MFALISVTLLHFVSCVHSRGSLCMYTHTVVIKSRLAHISTEDFLANHLQADSVCALQPYPLSLSVTHPPSSDAFLFLPQVDD